MACVRLRCTSALAASCVCARVRPLANPSLAKASSSSPRAAGVNRRSIEAAKHRSIEPVQSSEPRCGRCDAMRGASRSQEDGGGTRDCLCRSASATELTATSRKSNRLLGSETTCGSHTRGDTRCKRPRMGAANGASHAAQRVARRVPRGLRRCLLHSRAGALRVAGAESNEIMVPCCRPPDAR